MTFSVNEPVLLVANEENRIVVHNLPEEPTQDFVVPILIKKLLKNMRKYIFSTSYFSFVLFWIIYLINLYCLSPSCCDYQKNRLVFNIV